MLLPGVDFITIDSFSSNNLKKGYTSAVYTLKITPSILLVENTTFVIIFPTEFTLVADATNCFFKLVTLNQPILNTCVISNTNKNFIIQTQKPIIGGLQYEFDLKLTNPSISGATSDISLKIY